MFHRLWAWYNRYDAWLLMGWVLTFLALVSAYEFGIVEGIFRLALAWGFGAGIDFLLHRTHTSDYRKYPTSGAITARIALLVLPFDVPLWILLAVIVLGLLSKHFVRWNKRHIFNPAAFGIVPLALLTGTTLGWVGDAVPLLTILALAPVIYRVKKHVQVLAFLAGYLLLLFVTNPSTLSGDVFGFLPWFFALAMVPEPMTSVPTRRQQLIFGVIVAAFSFVYTYVPYLSDFALPAALLTGNLFAAYLRTTKI